MHSLFSSKAIILFFSLLLSGSIVSFELSADNTRIRGPKNADISEQGKQYGPIRDTDTLWRIATKLRPDDSVSIYQVMQAIFQKNPGSFLDNNINHLKTGAFLRLPSVPEIRSINAELAQERSELDDELWDKKLKGQISQPEIDLVVKQAENAKTQDVIVAKEELSQEIQQAKVAQQQKLDQLKDEFKSSVNSVEAILMENEKLKQQVVSLSNELQLIRGYLDTDRQTLEELKALLADQHRILAAQEAKEKADAQSFGLHKLTNNPLLLLLIGLVPGLLIVVGLVYWIRSRTQQPTIEPSPVFDKPKDNTATSRSFEQHTVEDPTQGITQELTQTPQSLDKTLDDTLDIPLDTSFDDSLNQGTDNIVALDDSLDDQPLPQGFPNSDLDKLSSGTDGLIDQSELDSLLDDSLNDEVDSDQKIDSEQIDNTANSDEFDAIFDQDYDLPNEQLDALSQPDDIILTDSEIALDIPEEQEPSSDEITNFADVDAIMDELSDDMPSSESEQTELTLDMDDIDAMIDEVESGDTDFDDLDVLLKEASIDTEEPVVQAKNDAFDASDMSSRQSDEPSDEDVLNNDEPVHHDMLADDDISSFDIDSIDEEEYVDNSLADPLFETIYESSEHEESNRVKVEVGQPLGEASIDEGSSDPSTNTQQQLDDITSIESIEIEQAENVDNDAYDESQDRATVDLGDDPLEAELPITNEVSSDQSLADDERIDNDKSAQNTELLSSDESALSNHNDTSDESVDKIISGDLGDTDDILLDEIESSDFDSLLNEIAESESPDNKPKTDIKHDDLSEQQSNNDLPQGKGVDINQPDYLDIDTLLEQSDEELSEEEPYNNIDMDVGLGDFEDLLAGEDSLDVDKENEGFSAKLDLAKAYLEINDSESALKVIDDVIENGPSEVQNEAQSIKEQLAES